MDRILDRCARWVPLNAARHDVVPEIDRDDHQIILTFARQTLPRWADRLNVVFLLDQSDSVCLVARERAWRFVADATKHMKGGDRQGVIVFGEQAVVDQPLSNRKDVERPKSEVGGRATDIFQAIQLALASLPPGQANRIVMLTDGRQTAGNALAGAQSAKDSGTDLYYVAAPLTFTQEVVAESMVLPQEVKHGEPFQAKVASLSPAVSKERRTLKVFFALEDPGVRLRPGMFAEIGLDADPRQVLLVPTDAVLHVAGADYVLAGGDGGVWRIVEVTAGEVHGGDIEIRAGVEAGQKVLGSGAILLKPLVVRALN